MNSRTVIHHPGLETDPRMVVARGDVSRYSVSVKAGENLLFAVSRLMEGTVGESGLLVLDGVSVGPFNYVMPSHSNDTLHAAWYSETHTCNAAQVLNATAIIGRRDGNWWMHCHALWDADNVAGMGHLLPDEVTLATDATVTLYVFTGGRFDVALDPETAFPLFHVHGERTHGNAFIARICPHVDIHTGLQDLINEAGFEHASIFGIGSLIGAGFEDGNSMECPISEVLVSPEAAWDGSLKLPMHCVDVDNNFFNGTVSRGAAPVLVTFEVMVISTDE